MTTAAMVVGLVPLVTAQRRGGGEPLLDRPRRRRRHDDRHAVHAVRLAGRVHGAGQGPRRRGALDAGPRTGAGILSRLSAARRVSVPRQPRAVLAEIRTTLALAAPLAAANLAQMAMGLTDTIMVGALGALPLAAVGLGSGVYFTSVLVCARRAERGRAAGLVRARRRGPGSGRTGHGIGAAPRRRADRAGCRARCCLPKRCSVWSATTRR